MTHPFVTQQTTLDAALIFTRCGWRVVPVPLGEKGPRLVGWPDLRLSETNLPCYFAGNENIAILSGEPSGGLTDVDLDAPEAQVLACDFLPATGLIHGRPAKPRSHRWYSPPSSISSRKFLAPDGTALVEIRSTGSSTLVPPSLHPSGERYVWHAGDEPARVDGADLERRVETLAAATLLARHWPKRGARHDAALALSGALLRAGWTLEVAQHFVRAVARAAGDEEADARVHDVRDTAKALPAGKPVTGQPRLAALLGEAVMSKVAEWLGLEAGTRSDVRPARPWPDPPDPEAFSGLAGAIVRAIAPHSEADPIALLIQLLVDFGNMVGPGAYYPVEADEHRMNVFATLVGVTSKSRKGTSQSWVRRILRAVDPAWADGCVQTGLSSGEGLIHTVRDPVVKREPARDETDGDSREVTVDPGITDKRLLVLESEFAGPLRAIGREGNILSAVIRQAWDNGDLRTLTKNSPAKATGAHISMIGHITRDELRRYLTETESGNGFANRFLWVCVRRSNVLADGGDINEVDFAPLVQDLRDAVEHARTVRVMRRDEEARAIWHQVYPELSEGKPGLLGAVVSRAEAQVVRLSCLYALLDRSSVVRKEHLLGALALWEYCESSARYIFGDALGDPMADEILRALRATPDGLTRTEIRDLFHRHRQADRIVTALSSLLEHELVWCEAKATGGRPEERWYAIKATKATKRQP